MYQTLCWRILTRRSVAQSDRGFILGVFALLAWGLYLLQPASDTASAARIAQLEARLESTERELASARYGTEKAAQSVKKIQERVSTGDSVMRIGLRRAKVAIEDTTTSLDTMRVVLARTVDKVELYQQEVLRYQESVDSLLIAHVRERQSYAIQIDTMQAVIDAQAAALMPCTQFGVRCPTRLQSFVIGLAVAIAVVVVL